MSTVGERIRYYRTLAGMSQEKLGESLDPPMQKSGIAKWENGRIRPKPWYLAQMEKLFDCHDLVDRSAIAKPQEDLVVNPAPVTYTYPAQEQPLVAEDDGLIAMINRLDPYDRGRIYSYVETYLRSAKYRKG